MIKRIGTDDTAPPTWRRMVQGCCPLGQPGFE